VQVYQQAQDVPLVAAASPPFLQCVPQASGPNTLVIVWFEYVQFGQGSSYCTVSLIRADNGAMLNQAMCVNGQGVAAFGSPMILVSTLPPGFDGQIHCIGQMGTGTSATLKAPGLLAVLP
jgi:hypothetical protein